MTVNLWVITILNQTSIQSLLDEPNPNSPANSQAAQMYSENRREYEKKVMQIVEERLVLDFFTKKCYRFDSVKSLKPAQVGTILNDMGI